MAFDTEVLTDNSQSLNICGIPNHIYENINMKGNQFYNVKLDSIYIYRTLRIQNKMYQNGGTCLQQ